MRFWLCFPESDRGWVAFRLAGRSCLMIIYCYDGGIKKEWCDGVCVAVYLLVAFSVSFMLSLSHFLMLLLSFSTLTCYYITLKMKKSFISLLLMIISAQTIYRISKYFLLFYFYSIFHYNLLILFISMLNALELVAIVVQERDRKWVFSLSTLAFLTYWILLETKIACMGKSHFFSLDLIFLAGPRLCTPCL